MGDPHSVRLRSRQNDAVDDMVETGAADDKSDAIRTAVDRGLEDLGYYSETTTMTQELAGMSGRALSLLTAGWLAFTFAYPVAYRVPAVVLAFSAAGCLGLERAIEAKRAGKWGMQKPAAGGAD